MWEQEEPGKASSANTVIRKRKESSGKDIRVKIARIVDGVLGASRAGSKRGGLFSLGAKGSYTKSSSYNSRRAVVKARIVKNDGASYRNKVRLHLKYIEREGSGLDGKKGEFYTSEREVIDGAEFLKRSEKDEHSFRFIVSLEDGNSLDLKDQTRTLIKKMENDLDTKLDWIAVDHYNTDDPHTHIVIRGVSDRGEVLRIERDYISNGIRNRAREIVTMELGHRTEIEISEGINKSIQSERITEIDHHIERNKTVHGHVDYNDFSSSENSLFSAKIIEKRLQYLKEIGLSNQTKDGDWFVANNFKNELKERGDRGDIIKMMNKEMSVKKEDASVFNAKPGTRIFGNVVRRGLSDEMSDNEYLVVRDEHGKNHYVSITKYSEKERCSVGDKVEIYVPKQKIPGDGLVPKKGFLGTRIIEKGKVKGKEDLER